MSNLHVNNGCLSGSPVLWEPKALATSLIIARRYTKPKPMKIGSDIIIASMGVQSARLKYGSALSFSCVTVVNLHF